jgi:hypothetical protein
MTYYETIVGENFKPLLQAFLVDIEEWKDILSLEDPNILVDVEHLKNGEQSHIMYGIIRYHCNQKCFGYFHTLSKLYISLCEKHEEKLLADAKERFMNKFGKINIMTESLDILVNKPNAIQILRLL